MKSMLTEFPLSARLSLPSPTPLASSISISGSYGRTGRTTAQWRVFRSWVRAALKSNSEWLITLWSERSGSPCAAGSEPSTHFGPNAPHVYPKIILLW